MLFVSPHLRDRAGLVLRVLYLVPQRKTALFEPLVQYRKAGKRRRVLPQAAPGILHVLFDLALLPTRRRIAERRLEQVLVIALKRALTARALPRPIRSTAVFMLSYKPRVGTPPNTRSA